CLDNTHHSRATSPYTSTTRWSPSPRTTESPIAWAGIDVDLLRSYRLAAMSNSTPLAKYLSEHAVDPSDSSGTAAEDHSRIALQMILDLVSQDERGGEPGED
ncbi:hypothetical protein ACUXMN_001016, partial [Micrococcus yunnanensis]